PAGDEIDQDFGVAAGEEAAADLLELGAQLAIIVDLAIEGDGPAARRIAHRLRPGRTDIDDGETPMTEHDRAIARRPEPIAIGTAATLMLVQPGDDGAVDRRSVGGEAELAGNAAHRPLARPLRQGRKAGFRRAERFDGG